MKNQTLEILTAPKPFLKWAGGKRWLAPHIRSIVPTIQGKYIEPFTGSAAIFFALAPKRALLSDVNEGLIETYRCVRDQPAEIQSRLAYHDALHNEAHYYEIRATVFPSRVERASQFIYLNRTCWNGLYRVNRRGEFNVPIGTKPRVQLPSDNWSSVADLLSGADLRCQDFASSIDAAEEGDLVFADPPYTVKHNLNGFIKYNESLFSWEDQIRLRDCLVRAKARKVRIVSTNADHASVRKLYDGHFDMTSLERASVLAGDASFRGRYNELLITAI